MVTDRVIFPQQVKASVRKLEKLALKGLVSVKAIAVNKDDFFDGRLGVRVSTGGIFDCAVKCFVPGTISCSKHHAEVLVHMERVSDAEIQDELGVKEYSSVEEAIASMVSRILMWRDQRKWINRLRSWIRGNDGHNLLTDGHANIQHARVPDDGRIIAIACFFDSKHVAWNFGYWELPGRGPWRDEHHFSVITPKA